MNKKIVVEPEIADKITEYVYSNYKSYKGEKLIITELNNCYSILKNKDGSPLFLGKSIIN